MNQLQHLAIIMDGNGRYAKEHGQIRTFGHKKGTENVRDIAIYCNKLGIKVLTLYAFSTENWKRPTSEVNYLMSLPEFFFSSYIKDLMANNIRVMTIGDIDGVPKKTRSVIANAIEKTKFNTGLILNLAMNYGGRNEIVNAAISYADDVANGRDNDLTADEFENYLYTKDLPPVDLMIRTSGEMRLSNFLLYQLAYSEMIFIDVHWPIFTTDILDKCLEDYQNRKRRFGGV
ncbi:MAG: isoprenyl transferase [Erysipelotrichaceae bacterium]|nr:isoprenyl transferase [Erysipelotrichaceae bacterium]